MKAIALVMSLAMTARAEDAKIAARVYGPYFEKNSSGLKGESSYLVAVGGPGPDVAVDQVRAAAGGDVQPVVGVGARCGEEREGTTAEGIGTDHILQ